MAVKIGHASIDERGKAQGGSAGDQTGKEVCTRSWYNKPWICVIRPKSATHAEKIAKAMEQACANNKIGYDQYQRTTLYTQAKACGWDLSKITTACETDCSALVAVCVNAAGITVSKDIYTGNEKSALNATGKFEILTASKYLTSDAYLKRGDILLASGHTAIVLSNGSKAGASTGGGNSSGSVSSSTKAEAAQDFDTLYSYIDKGIFLKLSNKDLPVKANKKRQYKKVRKQQKRAEAGESIEKRPEEVESREEFGHWEMDSVIGQKKKSKNTLLTLTERKTRDEIIFKLPDHTAGAVVTALDTLEKKWGELFKQVFKSITVDNGTEFALCEELKRSAINEGEKRTKLYYCHPYSSWERGTNEVTNKMVRRKVPKGTNFDGKTEEEIQEVEDWINGYPRRIHGYRSAAEVFEEEIRKLA